MLKLGETTTIGQIQSRYFLSPKQPLPYKNSVLVLIKVVGKL